MVVGDEVYEVLYDGDNMHRPVSSAKDKWSLLPAFFKTSGLVRQHIDSFNHFINYELRKIVEANKLVLCDSDPNFFLTYTNVYVGAPIIQEDFLNTELTPQVCRLRDMTYSAPIFVDIRWSRGQSILERQAVVLGRLPIMLRSQKCVLAGKTTSQLTQLGECPLDPGGYFVVKGVEKVILIQEQLTRNRIILEYDAKKVQNFLTWLIISRFSNTQCLCATVMSSTHERKSRCSVVFKKRSFFLRHNSFKEDIPIVVLFKALGVANDLEIVELVGSETRYSAIVSQFAVMCRGAVRDIDPTDDLSYVRIRSNKYEIMCIPDNEYSIIVIQDPSQK